MTLNIRCAKDIFSLLLEEKKSEFSHQAVISKSFYCYGVKDWFDVFLSASASCNIFSSVKHFMIFLFIIIIIIIYFFGCLVLSFPGSFRKDND